MVLLSDHKIVVCVQNPVLCTEPRLLTVCKAIRAIALPLFYRESSFACQPASFDVVSLQTWVRKREQAMLETVNLQQILKVSASAWSAQTPEWRLTSKGQMSGWIINAINTRALPPLPSITLLTWTVDDIAHWTNLLDWLKLYHEDKIGGYEWPIGRPIELKHQAAMSLFDITRVLRGQEWELVEKVLKEARPVLAATDDGWTVDHELVGEENSNSDAEMDVEQMIDDEEDDEGGYTDVDETENGEGHLQEDAEAEDVQSDSDFEL